MDVFQYNKSLLNRKRIEKVGVKTIVFVIGTVREGPAELEIRCPHPGKITEVYATCSTPGATNTIIDIEKCSQIDYGDDPIWNSIFLSPLVLPANKKSSLRDYTLHPTYSIVNEGDHFRVNLTRVGQGVQYLTVQVVVNVDEDFNLLT